jgi:hypothetical protein
MTRRILREKGACDKLGRTSFCQRTKFRDQYRLTDPADPYVPGTEIRRIRAVPLGPRNIGFLEHEIDLLIDGLAELRLIVPAGAPVRVAVPWLKKRRKPAARSHSAWPT